jgi:ATP-dependent Clp protease ATP-binding subunit ClpC
MWQRFTERARKVVFYSQEQAQKFGDNYVSPEHLLLGLLREDDSVAARVLQMLGVHPDLIRQEIERHVPRGNRRPTQDMTLTPPAKEVIDLAYDEARNLNNNYIGSEHLLLGLIRRDVGLAARQLNEHGATLEPARLAVIEIQSLNEPRTSAPPVTRRVQPPEDLMKTIVPALLTYARLHPADVQAFMLLNEPTDTVKSAIAGIGLTPSEVAFALASQMMSEGTRLHRDFATVGEALDAGSGSLDALGRISRDPESLLHRVLLAQGATEESISTAFPPK